MERNWRFVWQDNIYWGSCEPCTASVFSNLVRNATVNWRTDMRRRVERAVREGRPLDEFTRLSDFQHWCADMMFKPREAKKFSELALPAKLLRWVAEMKTIQPGFVFAVNEFKLVPRLDKDGNPLHDDDGKELLYHRRKQENILHLSGLFMSDYDHLPFDPRELYEKTLRPGYPWKTRLCHLTSSGEGLRLVSELIPGEGNIADQQYRQAQELGMLHVIGTTGKHVTDNSCVNADKVSLCPRFDDILFIDDNKLFIF